MILWNAFWGNHKGIIFTYTVPILRIMLCVLLTNGTGGSFEEIKTLKIDDESISGNKDMWIIRRKPSNPDAIKTTNKSYWDLDHFTLGSKLISWI